MAACPYMPLPGHRVGKASTTAQPQPRPQAILDSELIVDAHLDIAWNAISGGRGFLQAPAPGYLVSRQSLVGAEVGLIFPTIYTAPAHAARSMRTRFVYSTPHEAFLMAEAQVNYYRASGLDLLRTGDEVRAYARGWRKGRIAGVLLMESADPIEDPSQLGAWVDRGVRIIGPAWGRTRYSGGTHAPGGLTALGVQLLKAMRRKKVVLDISHMADRAVADAFELWRGPIMSSHSNARDLVPADRQITNGTAAEIARRGGMLGISFYEHHLRSSGHATLDDIVRHVVHLARAAGGPEHVGLGSDLDGGFDAKHSAMQDANQFTELSRKLRHRFSASEVEGIMGKNWLDFLETALPS